MKVEKHEQSGYKYPNASIFEKFSGQRDVSLVFGEVVGFDDKKVLPVAKVSYIVGGGYSDGSENNSLAQGEGGGGHFSIKPVGVYEITR